MFLNKYFLKNYWCIFWKSEELWTYSKKYIARFIKTSCKHPSSVRWFSINDNATSISGDGTFLRFWVQITTFISRSCVSYHKVYLRISRTANLWKKAFQIKYSTKTKFDTFHPAMIILKWNVNIQLYDARFLQIAANLFLNDSHCSTVRVNVTLFCGYQYI